MLGKLLFIVVLAKFAAATGEPAEEQNRPNGCKFSIPTATCK